MTAVLLFSMLLLTWPSALFVVPRIHLKEDLAVFENNVCNLHFYADPTLWRYFKYQRFGEVLTDKKTSKEIHKFFAGHISALKRIFGETEFTTYDGREMFRGIDFAVDRSTIMTDTTEKCLTSRPKALCSPDLTLDSLRSLISSIDHSEYCLAIFFSYRNFPGILGETWLPPPFKLWGGICDRYREDLYGIHREYKSFNVIWMTFVVNGKTLTEEKSHLVLAHEVGHALGSPHDDGPDCVPGTDHLRGNYLMYKHVSDLENRDKFSMCSKDNITRFLSSLIDSRHPRYNCLKPSISGGGLLHRFIRPENSSENADDPVFPKPNDEL